MSDQDARHMLDQAEQAATAGDLASADELLRGAARIQEQGLGPVHPDLANTLNNLAIVAEKTGRASEAEALYRRAAAIAAARLPSDHPMVVASRQNLEDFCRAHGLSIDAPAVVTPTKAAPPQPAVLQPDPAPPATIANQLPRAQVQDKVSHSLVWAATGAVVLVAALLLVLRPWSSHDASAPAPTPEPAATRPADAAPPPTAVSPTGSAPIEHQQEETPKAAPGGGDRNLSTNTAPERGGITVATVRLCRNFSTSGRSWRCDPVGDSAAPGPIVLYTRVRSPHDAAVVHRWYNGGTLRQSVSLRVQANATEGYRTYSRQTVDDGQWRVEVRSADGRLLNEQQFAVR